MWAVVGNRGGSGPPRSGLVGAGDLLDQIIKPARIDTSAFVRSFNEIAFCGGECCKGGESAIDRIGVVTADIDAFFGQILS